MDGKPFNVQEVWLLTIMIPRSVLDQLAQVNIKSNYQLISKIVVDVKPVISQDHYQIEKEINVLLDQRLAAIAWVGDHLKDIHAKHAHQVKFKTLKFQSNATNHNASDKTKLEDQLIKMLVENVKNVNGQDIFQIDQEQLVSLDHQLNVTVFQRIQLTHIPVNHAKMDTIKTQEIIKDVFQPQPVMGQIKL